MARFLIFLSTVGTLALIALVLWWLGNKIYISIRRENSSFEIEQEAHEQIKKVIREEMKE